MWFTKIVKCFQLQKINYEQNHTRGVLLAVGFKDGNQLQFFVIKLKFGLLFLEQSRLHPSLKLEQLNFA